MITLWNLRVADSTTVSSNAQITDLELPTIVREFDTDRRVGYAGSIPLPVGFGEMELSFTSTKTDLNFYKILGSMGEVSFLFTGVEQENDELTTIAIAAFGYVENLPLGTFSVDSSEYELTAKISRVEVQINGVQVLVYDPKSYVYSINGVNQMLNIRNTLGI